MEKDLKDLLEIRLIKNDAFLIIRETLTRMGYASRHNTLSQSCHILHKRGKYYIVHFKQMFELDGKASDITANDLARRNTIAKALEEWGLIEIIEPERFNNFVPISQIKIIQCSEKTSWNLVSKYQIGNKRR